MRKINSWARTGSGPTTLALTLALFLLTPIIGLAQSDNTSLSGFVRDAAGAVTPGARVVVKSQDREFERTTTTNEEGYYIVSNVPPGLYTISAEATGFKRFEVTDKKVDPGIPATVDVALQTGEVSETVSVIAETAAIQTETATVGKLVEARQIQYMQLNGRNPILLALLKPGVSGGALGALNTGLSTGGLNINGSRTQDNLITFDGAVAVRTRSNGTSIGAADVDATQEVQILTANYNAEYGRSAGGQVRIVTKSGTQDFHGTFYEFVRNNVLDANSWTRNRSGDESVRPCNDERFKRDQHCRPEAQRFNQFGYSLSGPVLLPFTSFNRDRSKLFWLFGQEWFKRRREQTVSITVPTALMRQGNFSELLPANNPYFGRTVQVIDPRTRTAANPNGTPFANNIIPAELLSPNGLALLNALPAPTPGYDGPGSQNFIQTRPTTIDQRKDTLSIDFYPTQNHQLRWRLQNYNFVELSAFRGNTDRAPQIIDRPNQTSSINWVWTISPTWINEALLAGSRDQVYIAVDTEGDRYRRSIYGINYNYIFNTPKEIQDKIPTVDGLEGFNGLDGGPYPSSSTGPIYQFSDNVTNIRGNHTIKFGGYFERAGQNDFDQINVSGTPGGTNNQNGRFVFSPTTPNASGVAIANAALGLFDTYAEIGDRSYTPYRGHMFEWFIQDSWKATPKLRLEFGLRHSIIQPYYSLWRNMSVFDPGTYDPALGATIVQDPRTGFIIGGGTLQARYNGMVIPGDGFTEAAQGRIRAADTGEFDFLFRGFDKQYSKIHWNNFQPRVGFAYSLNDKSVIRAGAGRFITRLGVSDSVFLGGNPPFQPTASVSFGDVDNPGGQGGNLFPLVITTQDPIFKNPEAWTWNVTFEREIGFDTTLEVGYVGRRGLHAQRERNINQLLPGTLTGTSADPNPDTLRPYRGFGIIRSTNNEANSTYNGLQLGATRRFTQGFSFGVAYTFSKAMDDSSAQRDVIPNAYDASNLWGPSTFDRRHVLVLNGIYEFPFFRDRSTLAGKILGGWTLSAVSQFQTGTPLYIATGADFAGVGPGSGSQFWNRNGDASISRGDRGLSQNANDPVRWFNRVGSDGSLLFTPPARGTFSTQNVRDSGLYGPGFQNHNLGLFKDFFFNETHKITLRAEAFNWVNHPNLGGAEGGGVNTDPTSAANFGRVFTKGGERNLQLSIRYSF